MAEDNPSQLMSNGGGYIRPASVEVDEQLAEQERPGVQDPGESTGSRTDHEFRGGLDDRGMEQEILEMPGAYQGDDHDEEAACCRAPLLKHNAAAVDDEAPKGFVARLKLMKEKYNLQVKRVGLCGKAGMTYFDLSLDSINAFQMYQNGDRAWCGCMIAAMLVPNTVTWAFLYSSGMDTVEGLPIAALQLGPIHHVMQAWPTGEPHPCFIWYSAAEGLGEAPLTAMLTAYTLTFGTQKPWTFYVGVLSSFVTIAKTATEINFFGRKPTTFEQIQELMTRVPEVATRIVFMALMTSVWKTSSGCDNSMQCSSSGGLAIATYIMFGMVTNLMVIRLCEPRCNLGVGIYFAFIMIFSAPMRFLTVFERMTREWKILRRCEMVVMAVISLHPLHLKKGMLELLEKSPFLIVVLAASVIVTFFLELVSSLGALLKYVKGIFLAQDEPHGELSDSTLALSKSIEQESLHVRLIHTTNKLRGFLVEGNILMVNLVANLEGADLSDDPVLVYIVTKETKDGKRTFPQKVLNNFVALGMPESLDAFNRNVYSELKAYYDSQQQKDSDSQIESLDPRDFVDYTNNKEFYVLQARMLLELRDECTWKVVLAPTNQHRQQIINIIVDDIAPDYSRSESVPLTYALRDTCRAFRSQEDLPEREEMNKLENAFLEASIQNEAYACLAQYLIESRDSKTWAIALGKTAKRMLTQRMDSKGFESGTRRNNNMLQGEENTKPSVNQQLTMHLIDLLQRSTDERELQVAMQAFITDGRIDNMITLLEKIVLTGGNKHFATNRKLQELLIIGCMKDVNQSWRIMGYISERSSLKNIDFEKIAKLCRSQDLYEEAFLLFSKAGATKDGSEAERNKKEALEVLRKDLKDEHRAEAYAKAVLCAPNSAIISGAFNA